VFLELIAVLPLSSAITASPITRKPHLDLLYVASAIFIWLVIWYLVSTVSESLRKRDHQLHEANQQLKKADEEKTRNLLVTTHDLKAPFTGIESNIQLLKIMYWDTISQPVKDIINKIEGRARTLRERVNRILMLESLKSQHGSTEKLSAVDLQSVLTSVLEELEEKIKAKHVVVNAHIPSTQIYGDIKQFKILFSNLLSNAVNYSYDEGTIDIRIEKLENTIVVYITDHGIGIKAEALPHIFEEYYRTSEAQEFNTSSTGLGMAIVKEIALKMGVNIEISSEQHKGTTTKVVFSKKDEANRLMKNHNLSQSPGMLFYS
jgi:signal transduction histidine kinase